MLRSWFAPMALTAVGFGGMALNVSWGWGQEQRKPQAPVEVKQAQPDQAQTERTEAVKSKAAGAEANHAAEDGIRQALDARASFSFQEVPLRDVAQLLREKTRVNVLLDREALGNAGLAEDTPVSGEFRDISLRSSLNLLLRGLDLAWTIDDGALLITTHEVVEMQQSLRVYNVADLIAAAGDDAQENNLVALMSLIETIVDPDTWATVGGPATVTSYRETLLVLQMERVHHEIDALLAALRQGKRLAAEASEGPPAQASLRIHRSAAEAAILQELQKPISLDLIEAPLAELPEWLQAKWGIQAVLDRLAMDDVGLGDDTPVSLSVENMPAGQALRHLLGPVELTWLVEDEVLQITTPEEADTKLETRVYPVRDLTLPRVERDAFGPLGNLSGAAELMAAISSAVAPDSWGEVGGPGALESFDPAGVLVITQTMRNHERVEALLADLRRKLAEQTPATAEAPKTNSDADTLDLVVYWLPIAPTPAPPESQAKPQAEGARREHDHILRQFGGMSGSFSGLDSGWGGGHIWASPVPGEDLVEVIVTLVDPASWSREGVYIKAIPGRLLVRHTAAAHRKIQSLLTRLGISPTPLSGGAGVNGSMAVPVVGG